MTKVEEFPEGVKVAKGRVAEGTSEHTGRR